MEMWRPQSLLINNLFTLPWSWTNCCDYLALHSDAIFFLLKLVCTVGGDLYFLIVSLQYKTVGWYGVVAPFQTSPEGHPTQRKTPGEWRWRPTPSSAEVEERIELCLYSPFRVFMALLGWSLSLRFLSVRVNEFSYFVEPTFRKSVTWELQCLGSLFSSGSRTSGWGSVTP